MNNDEVMKALRALVTTTERYYAANPEYKATEEESKSPVLAEYERAFQNAKRVLKKTAIA